MKSTSTLSMRVVAANLKLFYQRRGLWYWYVNLLLWSFLLLLSKKEIGILPAFTFASFSCGAIAASLQKEIMTKPFAFLLPAHRKTPRLIIFIVGALVNVPLGFFFMRFDEPHMVPVPLLLAAAAIFGMALFLSGARLLLAMQRRSRWGMLILLLSLAAAFILLYHGKAVEKMLFAAPLLIMIAGLAISLRAWRRLGDDSLVRSLCGKFYMAPGDRWNYLKLQRYQQSKVVESKEGGLSLGVLQALLLTKMMSLPKSSHGLYVIGNLYNMLGSFFKLQRIGTVLFTVSVLIIFLLFLSYFEPFAVNVFYLLLVIYPLYLDLVPLHHVFLPLGRGERYYSVAVSGFITGAFFTSLAAVVVLTSNSIIHLMPEILWKQHMYQYHAMDISQLFLCPLFIPSALIITIQFHRIRRFLAAFILVLAMQIYTEDHWIIPPSANALVIIPLITISWLSFVVFAKYSFRKRDLVLRVR